MERIYFINEQYIKDFSELQDDINIRKLMRNVYLTQNVQIKSLLGSRLYNRLVSDIKEGILSGVYKELFETFVQPTMLEFLMYKSVPSIAFALTNRGTVKKNSDNSESLELDEIKYLQQQYLNSAEQLSKQMIAHMKRLYCEKKLPEYGENEFIDEIKPIQDTSFGTGIYLGR